MKPFLRLAICAVASSLAWSSLADVRLPALFSDHMVLQRGKPVPVWGWADDGEQVTVSFRGKTARATAKDGKWMVKLGKLQAGGPDILTVEGKNRIELRDVLVGEVWVCSGQSNMEWPLKASFQSQSDIAASTNPNLRIFKVPKRKATSPQQDVQASWAQADPETVPNFSAVAYYFGRDLQQALQVPVGLVETCWGGSPAEVWMSREALSANKEYQQDILQPYEEAVKKAQAANDPKMRPGWQPSELYNAMIAPLIPYGIAGAIWYQGESNAGRADQYRRLFADMIKNWRTDWDQGNFPFLLVQLAPWDNNKKRTVEQITEKPVDSDWAELREAQLLATQQLPKVGMAVITDVGDKDDIHPTKKVPVGARLALAARAIAYGEKVEYAGPVFKKMKVKDGKAILSFTHAGSGLEARGGKLTGFAICGPDKKFVWADAVIEDGKVVVSSPQVEEPIAVRYGWANYPVVNLWNKAGLPATPFRTDDFPLTTARKK